MSTKTARRKAALLAVALGACIALPGSAVASHETPINHHTCKPGVGEGCPEFELNYFVGAQNAVTDAASSLTFEFSQPDRHMPVMRADYFIPKGWRFGGLSNLDPALKPDGVTPATSCNDIYAANGQLQNAEALSAATGMRVQVEANRPFNDDLDEAVEPIDPTLDGAGIPIQSEEAPPYEYGVRNPGGTDGSRFPSVSFLNWNGTSANLCYYHRNNVIDDDIGAPAEFKQAATLTRLAADPNFDWKLSLDVSNVYKNQALRDEQASILQHDLTLPELTTGNFNRNDVTGELSSVPFTKTPTDAGVYTFKGVFSTCSDGLDNTTATGCAGDTFTTKTAEQAIQISPPGSNIRHDFGKITGPFTSGLCFNATCPLGLLEGVTGFDATWSEPALPPGTAVKGYVLVVAEPGNQKSRYFRRIITHPSLSGDPDYSATACPAGVCKTNLQFPLQSTDGSTTLIGDTKYHLALITMYTDGLMRSDGLCDDGTGPGAVCGPSVPKLKIIQPGISTSQVLMRPDDWPQTFVEVLDDDSNGSYDLVTNRLLFVDYTRQRAEFVIWNTNSKVTVFGTSSQGILGDDDAGLGATVFGSSIAPAAQNWLVSGVTVPGLGAVGTFLLVDPKNPGVLPPTLAGMPYVNADINCPLISDLLNTANFGIFTSFYYSGTCLAYVMTPL